MQRRPLVRTAVLVPLLVPLMFGCLGPEGEAPGEDTLAARAATLSVSSPIYEHGTAFANGCQYQRRLPVRLDLVSSAGTTTFSAQADESGCISASFDVGDAGAYTLDAYQGRRATLRASVAFAVLPAPADAIAQIENGSWSSCIRRFNGEVVCWGQNVFGACDLSSDCLPSPVLGMQGASSIAMGSEHICGIFDGGTVKCLGQNWGGQLGVSTVGQSTTPIDVPGVTGAVKLIGGYGHACAILENGDLWCWGDNGMGQIGNGTTSGDMPPTHVSSLSNVVDASGGELHTCAVQADGRAFCWGWNCCGQIGNGDSGWGTDVYTPTEVVGLGDAVRIAASTYGTCAVRATGEMACWGENSEGELGAGDHPDYYYGSPVPVPVVGMTNAVDCTTGYIHNCALLSSGGVACWGWGGGGALGSETAWESRYVPTPVTGLTNAVQLAGVVEGGHYCALTATDEVFCWGENYSGQLGAPGWESTVPIKVEGI